MKRALKILLALIVVLILGMIAVRALIEHIYHLPPKITVVNKSGLNLEDVTLMGAGYSEEIGTLPAGSSQAVIVHPRGEAGLKVSFKVGTEQIEQGDLAYIESIGGYTVVLTIDESLEADAKTKLFGRLR